jgi:hypothetical protein
MSWRDALVIAVFGLAGAAVMAFLLAWCAGLMDALRFLGVI